MRRMKNTERVQGLPPLTPIAVSSIDFSSSSRERERKRYFQGRHSRFEWRMDMESCFKTHCLGIQPSSNVKLRLRHVWFGV